MLQSRWSCEIRTNSNSAFAPHLSLLRPQSHLCRRLAATQDGDGLLPMLSLSAAARHASSARHLGGLPKPIPRYNKHKMIHATLKSDAKTCTITKCFMSHYHVRSMYWNIGGGCLVVCPQSWRLCVRITFSDLSFLAAGAKSPHTWRWQPLWQVNILTCTNESLHFVVCFRCPFRAELILNVSPLGRLANFLKIFLFSCQEGWPSLSKSTASV